MNKKALLISVFILPNLRALATYLAKLDEGVTGADDEAAAAINYAIDRVEVWLMKSSEIPQAPSHQLLSKMLESLEDKPVTGHIQNPSIAMVQK